MKAYLDSNILIYLEDGKLNLAYLIKKIDGKIETIFYSSAHIQEAEEILGNTDQERNQRIFKRLNTIEGVTNCQYLYQNLGNDVFYESHHPLNVLESLRQVPSANNAMKLLVNLISENQKQEIRDSLGLESSKINNYSSDEVVEHLNMKIANWGQSYSFLEMMELGISFHPDVSTFGLSQRIAAIFELLDLFAYWKDKSTDKSNYARLWDSNHAFFASFCDYFISDDKRTRRKAQVVYNIYDIKTKVISSKGTS